MIPKSKFWRRSLALTALMAFGAMPVYASDLRGAKGASNATNINGINFGDDTSAWANDGECDDPRFEGPGTAVELIDEDRAHDATDCSTLYRANEISLIPDVSDIVAGINFGDNTSEWSNDGQCDDPRFDGAGTDDILLEEDMAHDANDCRSLLLSGDVVYLGDDPNMSNTSFDGIDFGDNTSEWANDIECDDPRFRGNGMADVLVANDQGRDANDCLALYQSGDITLAQNGAPPTKISPAAIDFGDDTSTWSNDGECDDPRFQGPGSADLLLEEDLGRDATDCSSLFASGQVTLIDDAGPGTSIASGFDFGDDSSTWSNDGECDDPRFQGPGSADVLLDEDLGRDATDCSSLFASGQVTLIDDAGPGISIASGFDFGDDTSTWSNDGECDDPRFTGPGSADVLLDEDLGHDATDCSTLLTSGQVTIVGGGGSVSTSAVDFGNDTSRWSNDGECDDPRFRGQGMSVKLVLEDLGRDASDCQSLFNSGQINLIGTSNIDFGDNNGRWTNDVECDDPRFRGDGMAVKLDPLDFGHDADDCQAAYNAGTVEYVGGFLSLVPAGGTPDGGISVGGVIDFGDDSGTWSNDGECDDPRFAGPGVAGNMDDNNNGRDATDCRTLYNAGQIGLLEDFLISFGDDSADWSNDGECDDPRFAGKAMATSLTDSNIERDATDCGSAFEVGKIYLIADGPIVFGDNTSDYANDNECDDPRFAGPGASASPLEEDQARDANDCRTLYRANQIYLK